MHRETLSRDKKEKSHIKRKKNQTHVGILYRSQDPKLIFDEPLVDLRLFHIMLRNDVFYCTLVQSTLLSPLLAGGKVELTGSKECREDSSYGAQSSCSRPLGNVDWPRDAPSWCSDKENSAPRSWGWHVLHEADACLSEGLGSTLV